MMMKIECSSWPVGLIFSEEQQLHIEIYHIHTEQIVCKNIDSERERERHTY